MSEERETVVEQKRDYDWAEKLEDGTIKDAIDWLLKIESKFGAETILRSEYGYGDYKDFFIEIERPETDKEMAARIKRSEIAKKRAIEQKSAKEELERIEYERLKKKFEGKKK